MMKVILPNLLKWKGLLQKEEKTTTVLEKVAHNFKKYPRIIQMLITTIYTRDFNCKSYFAHHNQAQQLKPNMNKYIPDNRNETTNTCYFSEYKLCS